MMNNEHEILNLQTISSKMISEIESDFSRIKENHEIIEKAIATFDNAVAMVTGESETTTEPMHLFGNYYYDGRTYKLGKTIDNGKQVDAHHHIYDGKLKILNAVVDLDTNKEELVLASKVYGQIGQVQLPKGEIFGKSTFIETINNVNGFIVNPSLSKRVKAYLYDNFLYKLQSNSLIKKYVTSNMGWYKDTFVYPNSNICIDGKISYKGNDKYDKIFATKGEIDDSINKVLLPILKTEIGVISVSATVGSLLLEILGVHESFILDIYGKNGKGKTTLLFALASLFGYPRKFAIEWNATKTAIISTASELNNFPLMLDDTKKCPNTDSIVEVVYSLTGGKDKERGNVDGSTRDAKTFKNIAISTGEASISTYYSSKKIGGGAFGRILSVDTDNYTIFNSKEDADNISNNSKLYYGTFGMAFCSWLLKKSKSELDNWYDTFSVYKDLNYRKITDHASIRKGNHIAILQLTCNLLEEFLKEQGHDLNLSSEELFSKFLKDSDDLAIEQDIYRNAFNKVLEQVITNGSRFYKDGEFVPHNLIGWSQNSNNRVGIAINDSNWLLSILSEFGDSSDILKEWQKRGYLHCNSRLQYKVTVPSKLRDGITLNAKNQAYIYFINTQNIDQVQEQFDEVALTTEIQEFLSLEPSKEQFDSIDEKLPF